MNPLLLIVAACLGSACVSSLEIECQKTAALTLPEFLALEDVRLVPNLTGGELTAAGCPSLTPDVTVSVNGQEASLWSEGGKDYQPPTSSFSSSSPERCDCRAATFSAGRGASSSELELSVTQGSARVLAHYDDIQPTLRRVPAPTPTDAPPLAVAFWLEAAQKLSRFELERVALRVEQWNWNEGLFLTCPLELRDGGLIVVTPCMTVGDPTHLWKPELRLTLPAFKRHRPATHCEGARCEPFVVDFRAFEDVFAL